MSNSFRAQDGNAQTETIVLEHPATGHTVEIIGVVHIADQSFWDHVNSTVANRAARGYAVHYEEVGGSAKDAPANTRGGKMMTRFSNTMKALARKAQKAGMVHQLDAIRYPADAVNTDMTKHMFSAAFDNASLNMWAQLWLARGIFSVLPPNALRLVLMTGLSQPKSEPGIGLNGINNQIILDERNQIATKAALGAGKNVVAVWGAAHLKGITANLQSHGYVVVGRSWHTAFTYPVTN